MIDQKQARSLRPLHNEADGNDTVTSSRRERERARPAVTIMENSSGGSAVKERPFTAVTV